MGAGGGHKPRCADLGRLIAIADPRGSRAGMRPWTAEARTLPAIYSISSAISTTSPPVETAVKAGPGYDEATGLGSPEQTLS